IQRGSALVQQLLTLARKTAVTFEPVNANAVVEGLMPLMAQTFPKTIDFGVDLEPDLPSMMADANQISQALLNLCVNARDAMPGGGTLTLKTQAVDGASWRRQLGEANAERYVCIEIADTGMGIDANIQKHIFEPFFTTKEVGQGTGLGLSVVYGIVKNHNGFIDVQSKPMHGTTFRLYLPAVPATEGPAAEIISAAGVENIDLMGCGRILVIEDESSMLYLLRKVLLRQGYQVVEASDGQMALDVYEREKDNIDAVLLDLGIPKISGQDVLRQMKQKNPDVKVIVASGYIEPELKSNMKRIGIEHFIDKPYLPDQVVHTLQSLLHDRDAVRT
ncbi:MAG: ATP-binding protein, partial [Candidatus Binatia bacterium]